MSSSSFEASPGWSWPEDVPNRRATTSDSESASQPHSAPGEPQSSNDQANSHPRESQRTRTHWPPRTCRICLETVLPTFVAPQEDVPQFLQTRPQVTYESEEGRLLSPCKCKGSSKYVHENCLESWRHADPSYGRRHYWQCPTCGFQYRLSRMGWGRFIASTAAQIALTILIFILVIFLLGFVADPILSLYLDSEYYTPFSRDSYDYRYEEAVAESSSWSYHFFKGFTTLGLVSFLRMVVFNPFARIGGGTRRGRDRASDISRTMVLIGVVTFLWAVWKGVRSWSKRMLERAGQKVMDVNPDDDDDDNDNDEGEPNETGPSQQTQSSGTDGSP